MKKLSYVLFGITAAAFSAFTYQPKEEGIKLPSGFSAQVFASEVGEARHLTVTPQGNVYVKLAKLNNGSIGKHYRNIGTGNRQCITEICDWLRSYNDLLFESI